MNNAAPGVMKLINAKPSPFGRKVIIALVEKSIPFEVVWDIPWHTDTCVVEHNPLEQLPILITPSGETLYESSFILEWLNRRYPEPPLMPSSDDEVLQMRQFQVLSVGVMEAIVRLTFEIARKEENQSEAWINRQVRKIRGGVAEIARLIGRVEFAVGDKFSVADMEIGSVIGHFDFLIENIPPLGEILGGEDVGWPEAYPSLVQYIVGLENRESFKQAGKEMFDINFDEVIA